MIRYITLSLNGKKVNNNNNNNNNTNSTNKGRDLLLANKPWIVR